MKITVRSLVGYNVEITDLGVTVPLLGTYVLTDRTTVEEIARSVDLIAGINANQLVLEDENNQTLSLQQSVDLLAVTRSNNAGIMEDLPSLTVIRTTDFSCSASFSNVTFDTIETQNEPNVVYRHATQQDLAIIQEGGLYMVSYSSVCDLNGNDIDLEVRLIRNSTSVVPGSLKRITPDNNAMEVSWIGTLTLSTGDTIALQARGLSGTLGRVIAPATLSITRMRGTRGAAGLTGVSGNNGAPGGTTVDVKFNDVVVASDISEINFTGNVTVTNNGSGKASILIDPTIEQSSEYINILSQNSTYTLTSNTVWAPVPLVTPTISTPGFTFSSGTPTYVTVDDAGIYFVMYNILANSTSTANNGFKARLRVNSTVVTGMSSNQYMRTSTTGGTVTNSGILSLTANSQIYLDVLRESTTNVYIGANNASIVIYKLTTAASLIGVLRLLDLQDTNISTPQNGDGLVYNSASGKWVNQPVVGGNVFGQNYTSASSLPVTTTTSTNWVQKCVLSTTTLPAGTYRIGWSYNWNHNAVVNDFRARLVLDGATASPIMEHWEAPNDDTGDFSGTGTDQKLHKSGFVTSTLAAGVHTVSLDFTTDVSGKESAMWNTYLEFWRVQ